MDIREAALLSICLYESAALLSRLPTISSLVKRVRHRKETTVAVTVVVSYLAYHLLFEEF